MAASRGRRECSLRVKQRVMPLLKEYRSEYAQSAKDSHLAAVVLKNVKDACSSLKEVQFGDHLRARNTLFNIILSEDIQEKHLVSSLSRQIGVSRRQLYRAMNSRQGQDRGEVSTWLGAGRKTRSDILSRICEGHHCAVLGTRISSVFKHQRHKAVADCSQDVHQAYYPLP